MDEKDNVNGTDCLSEFSGLFLARATIDKDFSGWSIQVILIANSVSLPHVPTIVFYGWFVKLVVLQKLWW